MPKQWDHLDRKKILKEKKEKKRYLISEVSLPSQIWKFTYSPFTTIMWSPSSISNLLGSEKFCVAFMSFGLIWNQNKF